MRAKWALLALVLVAACGTSARTRSATPRVVSLHEVTTEMIVALGATDRLVGLSDPVDPSETLARAVAKVPRIDGLESILALRPTVVLGLAIVGEQDPELVAGLRARGIEVWLGAAVTLADVSGQVRAVAARAGVVAAGEALVAKLEGRVAAAPAGAKPLRVFVYDCCDPPFTTGGKSVLSDVIARAGGENVFAGIADDWTHVSWEEASARTPDLVIVNAYDMEGQGDVTSKTAELRRFHALAGVPVVVLPLGEAMGGLRSFDALERLRGAFAKVRP